MSKKAARTPRRKWMLVCYNPTGIYFHDRDEPSMRRLYEKDPDYSILSKSFPTREAARVEQRKLNKKPQARFRNKR